ncbi:hypothetical protein [Ruminococcus sp. HUN007]|uniref:hypothetical protein n=1 Tax=Ruminococcus sp. HUN007 TaxID=1514668 RepID=UPI000A97CA76|nr:hypothetical protein [Ruminococcus sp. HUN007]
MIQRKHLFLSSEKTVEYNGEAQKLIDKVSLKNIELISFQVVNKKGAVVSQSAGTAFENVTATDADEYTVSYTFKPDGNHKLPAGNFTANTDGTYTGYVSAVIKPKPVDARWNSNAKYNENSKENEIVIGTQANISAYLEDEDVFKRDLVNGKAPKLSTENGNASTVGEYTAKATFGNTNYTLGNNTYDYSIVKIKDLPAIPTPSAGPITYGQTFNNAKLTEGWAVDGTAPPPNAGDHAGIEVHYPVRDDIYDYKDFPNYVSGDGSSNGYVIGYVDILVNPKELTVEWEDKKEFEYNGKVQTPAIVKVHGYIDEPEDYADYENESEDAERAKYPVNPEPDKANDYNGIDAGDQRAIPVINATKKDDGTDRPANYFIDPEGETYYKNYKITQLGVKDIEDVNVTLEYDEATLANAQEKLLAQLKDDLKKSGKNYEDYEFTGEFTADVNNEGKLDAGKTYSYKITYTYKEEKVKNHSGSFKENVTVTPSIVTVDVTALNRPYDGTSKPLVTVEKSDAAVVSFTVNNVDYLSGIPEAIDAGNYNVTYTVSTDANHVFNGRPVPVQVTVSPKRIEVQWKTNTTYNESLERNEIEYDEKNLPEVTPDLEKGALCERDKDKKLDYSASPEGHNVGDYTVKASLEDTNYELYNDEFTYTVTEGKADIKITDKLEATYGDPVSSVKLPENKEGTFKWKNPDEPVGPVGKQDHLVVFTPDDVSNYKKTEITVPVLVYPKDVHLIWNIENGHEFTFSGSEQNVTVRADLRDVYDDDEKEFAASFTADNLVNAGSHEAKGVINDSNYKIVKGTESRNFKILPSSDLKPMSYSETYEYGTTAKEIFDDIFAKHFGDFSAFAEQYSVDPGSVEVFKNGKKIDPTKYAKYIEAWAKLQSGMVDNGVIDQLNQIGSRIYNKPDFNIMTCYSDYKQIESLVNSNSGRIVSFIQAGVLPEASKYQKLVDVFERYESFRDAENIMQEVGDYKIVVNYNHMDDANNPDFERFLKLSSNYHPATLTAEVKITPRVINSIFADIDSRPYDGTTDLKKVNGYTFYSEKNGEKKSWTVDGYHTVNCQFVSPDAGTDKINTEIVLTNENFCFGYDYRTGEPVKSKKFYSADTDGCITKAEFPYTVNLEGFAGERLSSIAAPSVIHGTFKWNDTETLIAEGANDVAASEYTFTPDPKDKFNSNYDMKLTVKVNGVKKPVETVVETAVETVIVTGEPQPSETGVTGNAETTAAVTTPAGTGVTTADTTENSAVTTAKVTEATADETKPVTTAETEVTTDKITAETTLTEITLPVTTTSKLMGEVTEAPAIVTEPEAAASETKPVTTAKVTEAEATEVTTAETKAVTTAKVTEAETAGVTTAETKPVTTVKVTEAEKAGVTTAETKAVTTAKVTEAETAEVTTAETKAVTTAKVTEATTAGVTTADTRAVTTAKVTEAETAGVTTAETKAVTTVKVTEAEKAGVTTAETKAVTTAKVTEATTAGVTTAETKPVTTVKVTEAETAGVTTAETKPVTTAKVTEAETAGVTTAETKPVTTVKVTEAETAGVTTAETTVKVTEAETAEVTAAETKAVTTAQVTEAATAEVTTVVTEPVTTAKVTESETAAEVTTVVTEPVTTAETTEATTADVTTAAELPEITLPVVTTAKFMGDVTEDQSVVTEAVTTAQTEAVTTEADTGSEKTDLEKIREIIINEPEKVKQEVREDEKISINGEQIRLALEDKMFFQGTESFDYPVRLKDFNAEKAYFDYAGFGFELPEGFTVDPDSLSTDLKGNIKYYAPDSLEALALSAKTGYAAKGGYVVFRGVETRNLASDAVLFTVKIKVSDTLDTCISKIGVSALYGRLTENSKLNADGTVEPHVAFIDNNAGDQLYTKETSTVSMGVKGDVNLDGKVTQVDATVILREILSLEVFKKSLLADNINLHDGTPEEGVALSHFLGNVNQSPNGLFTQIDATSILRGILERDMNGDKIVTEQIWKKVTNK